MNDSANNQTDKIIEEMLTHALSVTEASWYTVHVTPELAALWLENRNDENYRQRIPRSIARFASDMEREQWSLTHQCIAFNSRGKLIDGQNRLAAIVASGKSVWMMVAVDFEEKENLDVGANRTGYDVLMARGVDVDGRETPRFRMVRRLWPKYGQLPLHVVHNGEVEIIEGAPF